MPSTCIDIRQAYSESQEIAMIDAVHEALVAAFKIPANDKHVCLVVHAPHRMATDPTLAFPERYTRVTVDCFAGRSLDAKRALYRELVARLAAFDIPADHVTVLIRESPLENWGIHGGQAACDVELGFAVNV